jgi:hypothetical protein
MALDDQQGVDQPHTHCFTGYFKDIGKIPILDGTTEAPFFRSASAAPAQESGEEAVDDDSRGIIPNPIQKCVVW